MIKEKSFRKERRQPRFSPPVFGSCEALGAVLRRYAWLFCSCLGWPLRYTGPPPGSRSLRIFWRREQLYRRRIKINLFKIKTEKETKQ